MAQTLHIEAYAIVSEDGMLADASGVMPEALKFEADQRFFERGLDGVDVVVHGRHSHEQQPRSHLRHRIVVTDRIAATAPHSRNEKALLWNPRGLPFEDALANLAPDARRIGIVGGCGVFGLFLDRMNIFYLSRAPGVRLPGGRPVFPGVPAESPEDVLARHGLRPEECRVLDSEQGVTVVPWQRP